jgi:glutamine amidotransferase
VIAIVDSGIANLRSAQKAFERLGREARVVEEPSRLAEASHIVLPGVGAFRDGIAKVRERGFAGPLAREIAKGKPVLGICLGLHLLFTESEEFGRHAGLDLLAGRVVRFPEAAPDGARLKVPHMGWNAVRVARAAPILAGIPSGAYFYFVHSYFPRPGDPGIVAGVTEYGVPFPSVVWRDNLFATQFHPEKSQAWGLRLLENFARLS